MNGATSREPIAAVERIRPILAEHRSRAEHERQLPQESYDATPLVGANLFAMLAPKAHGGLELHPTEVMPVWEAVSRIDSAAGWNLVMNGTVTGFIAWLPAEGAKEMLAEGPTTVAGALFPPQPARRVDGGWRRVAAIPARVESLCIKKVQWGRRGTPGDNELQPRARGPMSQFAAERHPCTGTKSRIQVPSALGPSSPKGNRGAPPERDLARDY